MTSLQSALRELVDAVEDFERADPLNSGSALETIVRTCEAEPLQSLLAPLERDFDVGAWWDRCAPRRQGANSGATELVWPVTMEERIACRLALCREAATERVPFMGFGHSFSRTHSVRAFKEVAVREVIEPLVRDIGRLSERRASPPILGEAISGRFPASGSAELDQLLEEARLKFLDKSPAARRDGMERLWDAWEMLKNLRGPDTRRSIEGLITEASPDSAIRELLNAEAQVLTDLGHRTIRHYKPESVRIRAVPDVDYLFHRMSALIIRLLSAP